MHQERTDQAIGVALCCSVFVVKKKDGSWGDYRALNKIAVKSRYPSPRLDDLRDVLAGAEMYSKTNLRSGISRQAPGKRTSRKRLKVLGMCWVAWKVMTLGVARASSVSDSVTHEFRGVAC